MAASASDTMRRRYDAARHSLVCREGSVSRRIAGLLVASALAVAACSSPATPTAPPTASPAGSQAPTVAPATPTPTTIPTASPAAVIPTCKATQLAARILDWQGAAGSRFADVQVTNAGAAPCRMKALDRPQLVDAHGAVLIDGAAPGASATLTLLAGAVLKTSVSAANYCGPTPVAPVSLAFVFPDGSVRFVATALSPTDTNGVPPCNGAPGSLGTISMAAWAP